MNCIVAISMLFLGW